VAGPGPNGRPHPVTALGGVTVLDLSDGVAGQFAGRILADLGAEVVLGERPGGSTVRRMPPQSPAGGSALFWHLNTGKTTAQVPDGPAGRDEVLRLARGCDAVIVDGSADPAVTHALGEDPQLVLCRLTEFADDGPYAGWRGCEMVHQALSGLMFLTGRPGAEPLYGAGHRAYYSAGAAAAVAVLTALLERRRSGEGQRAELSVHEVSAAMSQNLVTRYSYNGSFPTRHRYAGACDVFACADGWAVVFCPSGRWAGLCQAFGAHDLAEDERFGTYAQLVERWAEASEAFAPHLKGREVGDVVATAQGARVMAAPVMTLADVRACSHLAARGYWSTVRHHGQERAVLGPLFRMSGTPIGEPRPAPDLHAQASRVGGRTARPGESAPGRPVDGVPPARPAGGQDRRLPLDGVAVLELTTAWAGPMTGRMLAAFGATVIKVEAAGAMDVWRGPASGGERSRYPNFEPGDRPFNRNNWYNTQNHGKRSLAVDLKSAAAAPIMERLLQRTDVVLSNYASGVLERLGLGYDAAARACENIIMLQMPSAGSGGPLTGFLGVGPTMEALAGMTSLNGYGDGIPVSTGPAYADPIGALTATNAVLAALYAREQTGRGQHIEFAQREGLLHWIGEYLLADPASEADFVPQGNRCRHAVPHNAYPCRGDDRWLAVAVHSDAQWEALCTVLGRPDLAADQELATLGGRLRRADDMDGVITGWAAEQDSLAAAAALQRAGVPAAAVLNGRDIHDDAQLAHAGFFHDAEHSEAGTHRYQGLPFRFSATPARYGSPAPCLGEHTAEILREIGLTDGEIAALEHDGVVSVYAPNARPAG